MGKEVISFYVDELCTFGQLQAILSSQLKVPIRDQEVFVNDQKVVAPEGAPIQALGFRPESLIIVERRSKRLKESSEAANLLVSSSLSAALDAALSGPRRAPKAYSGNITDAITRRQEQEMRLEDLYQRAELNPLDPGIQEEIEEETRRQIAEKDYREALQNAPELFCSVHMLYIPVVINGCPFKAFVDSGARMTCMSKAAADACGLRMRLDTQAAGMAVGVGTCKILGRVHRVQINIGGKFLETSISVRQRASVVRQLAKGRIGVWNAELVRMWWPILFLQSCSLTSRWMPFFYCCLCSRHLRDVSQVSLAYILCRSFCVVSPPPPRIRYLKRCVSNVSRQILENSNMPLLLGLDMLKRHLMVIDFAKDALIVHGVTVPFLSEADIPHDLFASSPGKDPIVADLNNAARSIAAPPRDLQPTSEAAGGAAARFSNDLPTAATAEGGDDGRSAAAMEISNNLTPAAAASSATGGAEPPPRASSATESVEVREHGQEEPGVQQTEQKERDKS